MMMRQSAVRACSSLTSSALRNRSTAAPAVRLLAATRSLSTSQSRSDAATSAGPGAAAASAGSHAVSNPTLANIEKRWEQMPPQEQAELWMALRDRMTVDWSQMTLQEKRASYWIAFGPHGPRTLPAPNEKWQVLRLTTIAILASLAVFAGIRQFAGPAPKTMTKEWQEMSNEYLKAQGSESISGVSMEGYEGPGMVQSPPGLDKYKKDDDE